MLSHGPGAGNSIELTWAESTKWTASVLNFAVFQIASKFGPHRQDGRTMRAIFAIISAFISAKKFDLWYLVSAFTNCRMRHSFVNTSDVSEGS